MREIAKVGMTVGARVPSKPQRVMISTASALALVSVVGVFQFEKAAKAVCVWDPAHTAAHKYVDYGHELYGPGNHLFADCADMNAVWIPGPWCGGCTVTVGPLSGRKEELCEILNAKIEARDYLFS